MFRFLLLACLLAVAAAFVAPSAAAAQSRSAGITMGGGPKGPLWGYTVGSRAPDAAVASGTTKSEQGEWAKKFNKFFGKKEAPEPPAKKGSRLKRPGTI